MEQQQSIFKKKELVVAVSVALLSGVMSGCSSDDSDKSVPAVGAYTINATGGAALNSSAAGGYGGNGAKVYAYLDGGTGGIKVLASGKANAAFSSIVPAVSANLGSNPLNVAANATVEVAELWADPVADTATVGYGSIYIGTDGVLRTDDGDGVAEYAVDADLEVNDDRLYTNGSELYVASATAGANLAPAGTLYTHATTDFSERTSIYTADGSSTTADAPHTGIAVASGATLTLGLNYDGWRAQIKASNDVKNDGTITTADNGTSRGAMALFAHNYLATGAIDTSGTTTANNGGRVEIAAAYALLNSGAIDTSGALDAAGYGGSGGEIGLDSSGYLKNSGALSSHGADSATLFGGGGGEVTMDAAYIENSGAITTRGGNSADGYDGYMPGDIRAYADFGVNNSGNLTATGGSGGNGGEAGYVRLQTTSVGTTRNSGTITSSSGNGTVGYAGYKASVWLEADGGDVINSGDIITAGGSGVTGLTYSSNQGKGGNIRFATDPGDGATPPGDVIVSGNLDTRGGSLSAATLSSYAGNAGRIYLEVNMDGDEHAVTDQSITLLGYTGIDTSGGNGAEAGYADGVYLYADDEMDGATLEYKTGPVVNEVDITARGGNGIVVPDLTTNAYSNRGGSVYMQTAGIEARLNTATRVTNSGDIDVSGGDGYNMYWDGYNYSGYIRMYGYHGVTNSGALAANGGSDTATDGATNGNSYGSYANSPRLEAETGAVVNSGAISNNGGDGEHRGGWSDGVRMYGATVKNSGALSSNGGNADATLVGSIGGDGGESTLWGSGGLSAVSNSGTLSYSGGTGETAGDEGNVWVGITCVGNCTP